MIRRALLTAATVLGLVGGMAATSTSTAPPAGASTTPAVVAFNHWRGTHYVRHWFGSVRPTVLGGKFGEPVQNLTWQSWSLSGAKATGLFIHMSCQPCHVTVTLSHAKLRPSGTGHFFNWLTIKGPGYGEADLRWSFRQGTYVER